VEGSERMRGRSVACLASALTIINKVVLTCPSGSRWHGGLPQKLCGRDGRVLHTLSLCFARVPGI
jgi:hypothetical protein